MNSAGAAAAVKSAGEARHYGIEKYGAMKESELAVWRRSVERFINTNSDSAAYRLIDELRERFVSA